MGEEDIVEGDRLLLSIRAWLVPQEEAAEEEEGNEAGGKSARSSCYIYIKKKKLLEARVRAAAAIYTYIHTYA
jgi:hypothetical protein